jgi:hypothetical protein
MKAVHDATGTMLMIYEPTCERMVKITQIKSPALTEAGLHLTSKALD